MPRSKVREKRARLFFEKIKGVFATADCILAQTATALGGVSYNRAWNYLKILAEMGEVEIHIIKMRHLKLNLYCASGRRPERIYFHNGRRTYLIKVKDIIDAVERTLRGFASYTAAVRLKNIKEALGLPNTAPVGILLRYVIKLVLKDAVIREEVRVNKGIYSLVLVADRDKALKHIEEWRRGSSSS
jgi:hypothetical protein